MQRQRPLAATFTHYTKSTRLNLLAASSGQIFSSSSFWPTTSSSHPLIVCFTISLFFFHLEFCCGNYYIICNINRTHTLRIYPDSLTMRPCPLAPQNLAWHAFDSSPHLCKAQCQRRKEDESLLGCLDDAFRETKDNRGRRQKTQSACGFSLERPI